MDTVTREDREHELRNILALIQTHPERDWTEAKERASVLREMLKETDPQAA